MANDESEAPVATETKQAQIQIGIDWDNGMVVLQPVYPEGGNEPKALAISIPAEIFVQAGVSIGMQLLDRLKAASPPKSGIQVARPGDLPPEMRLKLH